jgi:hypothetical protein
VACYGEPNRPADRASLNSLTSAPRKPRLRHVL